jgi:20S proteasome alpha/beta subunit
VFLRSTTPCLVPSAVQSRPFGVALLVAGWDEIGPVL